MSDQPEPRWELLPHDPEQFFGLSGDFDLRDLKRSYNRLIRRFKPEKCPDEFQRIRAAYESLNDAMRYNLPSRVRVDWPVHMDRSAERTTPSETPPPATNVELTEPVPEPTPEPVHEQLAATAPPDLYAKLQSQPTKTPNDYVALALLSDVVSKAGAAHAAGESFVGWLLTGIADHPNDWGLTGLLRVYLSEEHTLAEIVELLLRVVEVLPPDRFQYTTEQAWDRLLREAPFDEFRDCLQRCGTQMGKSVDPSQLVFYIHVLKLAVWKADDDFLREIQETIDDHFHTLDAWAQEEYEMVSALIDYKARREEFVQLGPCCERIDGAIRDWCMLPETEGDLSVLDCQYFLSTQGQRLLDEFPDPAADFTHVLLPWDRIVADVLDRLDEPAPHDETTLAGHAKEFMVRITRRSERTFRYYRGLAMVLGSLAMFLITIVTSGAFAVRLCWRLFSEGRYLDAFLDGLSAAGILLVGFIVSLFVFYVGRQISALRYGSVRRELIKLLRVAPLRIDELATIVAEREDEKYGDNESIDNADKIAAQMRSDAGIELFSQAQVCLNAASPEPVVEAVVAELAAENPKAPSRPVPRRIT